MAIATLAIAKTDIGGCTSSASGASLVYWVPGTGEICSILDCGGGRAPPKTTVPGCAAYVGTATYEPSYLPGWGPEGQTSTEAPYVTSAASPSSSGYVQASETKEVSSSAYATVSGSASGSAYPTSHGSTLATITSAPYPSTVPTLVGTGGSSVVHPSGHNNVTGTATLTTGADIPEHTGAASGLNVKQGLLGVAAGVTNNTLEVPTPIFSTMTGTLSTILTAILLSTTALATTPLSCPASNATLPAPRNPLCQTVYPSTVQILSSLYPANESAPTRFFQLIHQTNITSGFNIQVASQVQFLNIGAGPQKNCTLELQLPVRPDLTNIKGPKPIFKVFNVAKDPGAKATWNTFSSAAPVVGTVNGTPESLARARGDQDGLIEVANVKCNQTMTFQMAMVQPDKEPWFNYWDFLNVAPPAEPVQGWRVSYGC
ncbi:hypothetical protein BU24DRAFT_461780 [Aaosphaeria arxii CBS 175.79]|uniref:Ubiquitin 3 binding protein But2 C-terminal domain-containing protein n=1 Tax=Aaosphaeria arxii CBS 175.79 TaxID=1450172 RepID=A0A6A5XQI6_9PLEO|nr:uncharacterized protein BU24DRAFT_461780 [Aaosphaeria arxii CBS 175.79]KAF2015538.1 hypothetical protein BU24DRAFT_461780 [Aaosphaeria arxii CBS 175.79]